VRTRVFRWVTFAATTRWDAWADDLFEVGDRGWSADKLRALFDEYSDAYPTTDDRPDIGIDGDARSAVRFVVADSADEWQIEQILADPEAHDEWYLSVTVDLAASIEAGDVVAYLKGLHRR